MGMPGSETAQEELMCRVLGDLIHEGVVSKFADDLYCGADLPEELLHNWKRVLQAHAKCNLKLSASKTVINPKFTVILCWIWDSTLQASPHCNRNVKPEAVGRLKSFIDVSTFWPALYPSAPPKYHHWTLSSQVASLTRGFNGLMIYSHHNTVLILPFLQAGPSSSPAPMINFGSPPTVLSKLQELVLPWT